ncbi:MAG: hypothetical protein WA539_12180, partial [Candidatus Sulfotelmatobacter sp.]
MNKELFVSSTPHETKVGLVEDDLLAEIYLERENEYTLAGSVYKGRVTRVLPGMQSAFVDIGLERDAFLYVSDFMELEEHDEDLTDVIPANRGVQDMREQTAHAAPMPAGVQSPDASFENGSGQDFGETEEHTEAQPSAAAAPEPFTGASSQDRERGGWRGRRRRGGRRDGRSDARAEGRERSSEPRSARPPLENAPPPVVSRPQESGRTQHFGPPAGYQPILLPGESISKYRGLAQPAVVQERRPYDRGSETAFTPAPTPGPASLSESSPVAATFPDDEPIFAGAAPVFEAPPERHVDDDSPRKQESRAVSAASTASTSVDWNREFRRPEPPGAISAAPSVEQEFVEDEEDLVVSQSQPDRPVPAAGEPESPAFAPPGTLEEETIDEEEADTLRYEESSDEGYDEFEEETRAAIQPGSENAQRERSEIRETVDEIHMASLAEVSPSAE